MAISSGAVIDYQADVALATLAALQGGLLMAQLERDTRPLEAGQRSPRAVTGSSM